MYIITIKNGKYKVGRFNNNLVNYNLDSEEKALITIVIDGLLPGNNDIKLLPFELNGNVYDLSVSNNIYLFNPEPNIVDLKILNNIFNNQSECVYLGYNQNKNENFIKRFVKIGKRTIVVLLSSTMLLSVTSSLKNDIKEQFNNENVIISEVPKTDDDKLITIIDEPEIEIEKTEVVENDELPTETVEKIQEDFDNQVIKEEIQVKKVNEKESNEFEEEKNDQSNEVLEENDENIHADIELPQIDESVESNKKFDFNKIIEAVNSNPNIAQEEKNVILFSKEIFEDDYGYSDFDVLLNKLKTLKIEYVPESKLGISGEYYSATNEIKFYNASNFEEVRTSVFTHEFSHLIQRSNIGDYGCGSFLLEGTNVIANNEYYGNNSNSYDCAYGVQSSIIKALGEVLGKDVIKKLYNSSNLECFYNAMSEIGIDSIRTENFIELLDAYQKCFYASNTTTQDLSNNLSYFENKIKAEIKEFYELKYSRAMDNDLVMLFLLDNDLFKEKIVSMNNLDDKNYFYAILMDEPTLIKSADNDKNYIINFEEHAIVGYDEESYDDCLNGGLINEDGETMFSGLIIDKENNKVLRPQYSKKDMIIEINDNNRYIENELSR